MPIESVHKIREIYTCDVCYDTINNLWNINDWLIDEENNVCLCPKHTQRICKNCGRNFLKKDWRSDLCSKACQSEDYRKSYNGVFKANKNIIKYYSDSRFSINDGDFYDIIGYDEDGYAIIDWKEFEKAIKEILNV
jgi:hypothetical protein